MLPLKKRARITRDSGHSTISGENSDIFHRLPEDLVLYILCKLSSSVSRPSDFINVQLTCKRLRDLALHPPVLAKAGEKLFAIRAEKWSESAHRFLRNCVNAGNVDAWYTLGMIRFYCLENRPSGLSLMAKAAMKSHAPALYSLAVIQFNGSGGSKNDKDLKAGVALCARAAGLGHIDALRQLGHCLQDGYGVRQNIVQGRRLILQANACEVALVLNAGRKLEYPPCDRLDSAGSPLRSDFGCNVPALEMHPVNLFLKKWFTAGNGELRAAGLRLCSHGGCGRPETRAHEFRQCSVCGIVNYCSRGCQALDWRLRHKVECVPMERWLNLDDGGAIGQGMAEEVEGAAVF